MLLSILRAPRALRPALWLTLCAAVAGCTASPPVVRPRWAHPVEPGRYVNWTAISAGGETVAAGSFLLGRDPRSTGEYATYFFRRTGELLLRDPLPPDSFSGVFWVDVSADGAHGASGGLLSRSATSSERFEVTGFIRGYQLSPVPRRTLDHRTRSRVNAVALSSDGAWLAAGSGDKGGEDNRLWVFRREESGAYALASATPPGSAIVGTIALSANGRLLASGHGDHSVRVHEISGTSLQERGSWAAPAGERRYIHTVRLTPDGTWLAATSSTGTCYLFRTETLSSGPVWELALPGASNLYGLALSADGRFLAVAANGNPPAIHLVESVEGETGEDQRSPRVRWTHRPAAPPNPGISMDARARFVAYADGYPVGTPGHFTLLDRATGKVLWSYTTADMSWPMAISQDGTAIAAGSNDSRVYYFDVTAAP